MIKTDNSDKFSILRKEYGCFIYEGFDILINEVSVNIEFKFNLSDKYFFSPAIKIPKKNFCIPDSINESKLYNIAFHIGMIELISYWKAACPPKIIIKPYFLDKKQINWWKNLYFNGLAEFFYLNSINTDIDSFVEIIADSDNELSVDTFDAADSTIIPVGGGKDSVVTLELLSEIYNDNIFMIVNPRRATIDTLKTAGYKYEDYLEIHRTIHPQLLELNEKGFLNGHTPFSALLAFVSLLAAAVTGKRNIALSNEYSANEATVEGTNINHQYSKSFEFERNFRDYVSGYISEDFNYYSFLRPLNELQIVRLFSGYPRYFSVFKSCNAGSKQDIWCGKCSKCLFAYIMLSAFVRQQELEKIFGNNLFENKELLDYFNRLTGVSEVKPFECVGTIEEVNVALCMAVKMMEQENLPYLLKYYVQTHNYSSYRKDKDPEELLKNFNDDNFLSKELVYFLKSKIDD